MSKLLRVNEPCGGLEFRSHGTGIVARSKRSSIANFMPLDRPVVDAKVLNIGDHTSEGGQVMSQKLESTTDFDSCSTTPGSGLK